MQHPLYREYQRLSRLDKKHHLHARRRFNRQLARYLQGGFVNDWWASKKNDIINRIGANVQPNGLVTFVPGRIDWENMYRLKVYFNHDGLTFSIDFTGDEDLETHEFGGNLRGAVQQFAAHEGVTEAAVVDQLFTNIGAGLAALERAYREESNAYCV